MKKSEPSAEEVEQLLALFQQKRFADGETLSRNLGRTYPQSAFAWKSLGVCLNLLGRKRDAADAMAKSAELAPGDAEIHFNLGTTLNDLGRWEEAEPCFRRAIELKPGYIEALNNLGDALTNLGRAEDAEEVLRRAIETRPDGLEAHFNLGNALRRQRRFGEAESSFRRALELQPGNVEARHNLGFLLLSLGRYAEGWPHYETRYHPQKKGRQVTPPDVPFPQWQGEPLAGKSLLVWPEQGFGDEIQFARYVPLLKAGGVSRLTLVCKPPLKALLETVTGADAVLTAGEHLPPHDYWVFPLSLPLHFGTTLETVPAALPYLRADPERMARWRPRLPEKGFKVGLVWRGSAAHKNDANRSLPGLAALAPLWAVPGASFVSLQKGAGEEEAESPPEGQPVLALGKEIGDFADTAAIVAQLDLVVCADTSVAHLAGALGKPCWVLLPAFGTDWRWLHERTDSPWYPGALRLFRQTSAGNWEETVAEVARALGAQVGGRAAPPSELPVRDTQALVALFDRKQFAEGEALAGEIVRSHQHSALAWYVLGVCRMSAGRFGDAVAPMHKAAELDAGNPEVHCNLGIALKRQGRLADAERSYRRAIALKPAYAEAHYNLGIALGGQERFDEAEDCYRQAIRLAPQHADATINLGNALKARRKLLEAEHCYRRAIELRPDDAPGHYNLGTVLNDQGRLSEAETSYRRAIELAPDYAQAHGNLGNVLKEQGRFGEAESRYGNAIALKQNYAQARTNLGILLLSLGRYAEGWPYYEARYGPVGGDGPVSQPRLPFPQWQGEPLAGKSLLVWREQGFGDEIQFARYLPLLKARGVSRLTLVGQPPLASLLRSVAGVDAVIAGDEPLPPHDYWAFPLSLPLHFGTTLETVPAALPYLAADPERMARWRPRLPEEGFKVGLVWRGSAAHKNDANRSLPGLAVLAPLWKVPGASFVSLQKGAGEEEAESPPEGQPVLALGKEIGDFADTAAIVAQLDLVVCVDTSVAHLAGALGKPCWVLLPAAGTDWRWLHGRTDSPWYPGALRLFRQTSAGNWEETVAEVARALMDCAGNLPDPPHAGDTQPAAGGAKPPDTEIESLVSLFAQKRFAEAEIRARAATGRYPRDAFAWKALGACLSAQGKKTDAIEPMQKAAALEPDDVENHLNLALALKHQGRLEEAEDSYRRVVGLRPEHVDALVNLGNVSRDLGRTIDAERHYRRAIALKPDCAPAHFGLGVALNGLGRLSEAESSYRRAIEIKPGLVRAHGNLGNTLKGLGRLAEAESSYRRAIELDPQYVHATFNLGVALNERYRDTEAENLFRRTIELQPSHIEAAINLGNILKERQDWGEAERWYRHAIALRPESAEARHNLGILLLSLGRYRAGWPYYEARYRPELKEAAVATPKLAFPQWRGEALAGKSLAIWPEQGLGDEIQFARYLPLLKARGVSRLTLICQPGLKPLLQSMAGTDAVLTAGEHLPPHDYWAFPLSLPLHFGTTLETVPAALPYLAADPERMARWRPRLPEGGFKVGLVWRGSAAHKNDANRSLPGLAALAPLWAVPGASFVSLQKGAGEDEAASPPAGQPIVALGREIGDFADTAAIVAQLDLVVCADTSVAHLAGALGKPCWVLLPAFGTDWRWLHGRTDSPWYPGALRLFRQTSAGNWEETVAEVARALGAQVGGRAAPPSELPVRDTQALVALFDRKCFDEGLTLAASLAGRYPGNAFAWKALGACLTSLGRKADAIAPMRKAAALDAGDAEAHLNLAIALKHLGRLDEAEASYRQVIRLHPDNVQPHLALAGILNELGRPAEAETLYRRAIELRPGHFRAHGNLANVLKAQGRVDEAEATYRRAIELEPDYLHAHFNLAVALQDSGRLAEAEERYRKVIALKPDHLGATINLGAVLSERGRPAEAETTCRRALEIKADDVAARVNLGKVLHDLKRLPEAEAVYRRAIELDPGALPARGNLGNVLIDELRFDEAESCFRHALELDADYAGATIGLGNALKELGRFAEAESSFRRAIDLVPEDALAKRNLAMLLLSLGRYAEGWPYYEARYDQKQKEKLIALPPFPFPQWAGEPLAGKSVLIWPEQGFGDEIQFARYASSLRASGASRVTLVCKPPLRALLQSLAGADAVVAQGGAVPPHDYWAFPLSLPLHLGTTLETVPATLPYLAADPRRVARWRGRLPKKGMKVGLVWRGNAGHKYDAHRSLPGLAVLAPLWKVPGASFVSLQKGAGEEEAESPPEGQPVLALGKEIGDFADTAAIVAQLDLVVCVDTSVAHLAGALGKPCWVLLPAFGTDWRWLHGRTDSPWYPGALRLFRQTRPGRWDDMIEQIAEALARYADTPGPPQRHQNLL